MTRRRKPHNPHAVTVATLERQEREAEIARLKAIGAEVNLDPRNEKILSAKASNVITRLLASKSITKSHEAAFQWIAKHWAIWKGIDGQPGSGAFVDKATSRKDHINDRMIHSRCVIDAVMARMGPTDPTLLRAFLVATVEEDRAMHWRGIVERETGVTDRAKQVQRVVTMLDNLRAVREG